MTGSSTAGASRQSDRAKIGRTTAGRVTAVACIVMSGLSGPIGGTATVPGGSGPVAGTDGVSQADDGGSGMKSGAPKLFVPPGPGAVLARSGVRPEITSSPGGRGGARRAAKGCSDRLRPGRSRPGECWARASAKPAGRSVTPTKAEPAAGLGGVAGDVALSMAWSSVAGAVASKRGMSV